MFSMSSRTARSGFRAAVVAAALVCVIPSAPQAQTVTGQISGRVTSGAYGTINSANPSRQMQIGIRLDF